MIPLSAILLFLGSSVASPLSQDGLGIHEDSPNATSVEQVGAATTPTSVAHLGPVSNTTSVAHSGHATGEQRRFREGAILIVRRFETPTSVAAFGFRVKTTLSDSARVARATDPTQDAHLKLLGSNNCKQWTEIHRSVESIHWPADVLVRRNVTPADRGSFFCYGVSIMYFRKLGEATFDISDITMEPGPLECCDGECKDYRGHVHQTDEGVECQEWSKDTPHERAGTVKNIYNNVEQRKAYGLDANYCRNTMNHDNTWCYTVSSKRWDNCHVPACPKKETKKPAAWLEQLMGDQ